MANHSQLDIETKGDLSDRAQAISGPSSDLSSSVWQDMRSEKSSYLDAQPKRFSLSDSSPSSTNSSGSDSSFSIRTGFGNDSSYPSSLPAIDLFDSAATTQPQAGGIEAAQAQPASSAGSEAPVSAMKWETYSPSYVGTNISDSDRVGDDVGAVGARGSDGVGAVGAPSNENIRAAGASGGKMD